LQSEKSEKRRKVKDGNDNDRSPVGALAFWFSPL